MKLGKINRKVLGAIKITYNLCGSKKCFRFWKFHVIKDDLFLLHLNKLSEHQSHLRTAHHIFTQIHNPKFPPIFYLTNYVGCFHENKCVFRNVMWYRMIYFYSTFINKRRSHLQTAHHKYIILDYLQFSNQLDCFDAKQMCIGQKHDP